MPRTTLHEIQIQQPFLYPTIRSQRACDVARYFELDVVPGDPADATTPSLVEILPPPGRVTLVTGASGSGKSSLLRAIRGHFVGERFIDLTGIELPALPIVDLFPQFSLKQTLEILSRVGLTEAWTYLRTPVELSDGQRWRLRLALAIGQAESDKAILLCDEFAALLDRITARIVAHRLARLVEAKQVRTILATSHDDLELPLKPAVRVRCDFNVVSAKKT